MTPLFKKLNLGTLQRIHVLNAPESFEPELAALAGVEVKRDARGKIAWALAFAVTQDELDKASRALAKAADGDAQVWIAYPKGSSKRYRCEFNRDSGWTVLRAAGFDTVRMVAIDEDWSALRFRRSGYIKTSAK
ncbi:MAG: hypothetical protein JSS25_08055 [Proteobacteria bacterium]|nr:hypothetical protein [Pseudomonadota bacterium]